MKGRSLFPILVLLFGPSCFGQASSNRASQDTLKADLGYSITVSPPSGPVRLGAPANIAITVMVGRKEIAWRSQSAYADFQFSLKKDGREVETTLFYRRITGKLRPGEDGDFSGNSIVSSFPPGKSLTFPIDVAKLYEIKEPGVYTLEVSRFDEFSKTTVRAKSVTLNIGP